MKPFLFALCLIPVVSHSAETIIPSETAARETLRLTREESTLRLGGFDLFPRASASATYDDNILIHSERRMDDLVWTLAPGLSIMGGDIGAYVPGSLRVDELRNVLFHSLVEDTSKPRRFVGLDYSPTLNFFTDHDKYNFTGHSVKLTGGYAFTRTAVGLDFDFDDTEVKNNTVGTLTPVSMYNTRLRGRYDLTDRTSTELNARYYIYDYQEARYQGYEEVSTEAWLNTQLTGLVNAGLGAGFGFTFPEESPDQVFEQILARAIYRLSGKVYFSPSVGVEFRQYDSDESASVHPVFAIAGVYQPRQMTSFTMEGHRRDEPSPTGGYNYQTMGGSVGVRQVLFRTFSATLSGGYDHLEHREVEENLSTDREDDYFSARLGVEYRFNRHLVGGAFYNFYRDDSTEDTFSYNNNLVGLQVSWRY